MLTDKKLTKLIVNFFKLTIGGWNYANKAIFYFAVVRSLVKKYGKDNVINTVNKIAKDIEIKK